MNEKIFCGCGDQIMANDGAECGTCVTARNTSTPWIDLTDEELFEIWMKSPAETEDRFAFVRNVMSLLKERNS